MPMSNHLPRIYLLKPMRNLHLRITLVCCFVFGLVGCLTELWAQEVDEQAVKQQLIGTWVLEEDPKSSWVFSDDELKGVYDGTLRFQGSYSVTDECMGESPTEYDEGMLFAPSESGADICAVIQGLSEDRLTLLFLPSGRFGFFVREEHFDE